MSGDGRVEDLLRGLAPQVLGALVRRHRSFDLCEDAVQDALIEAAAQWPAGGIPGHPRAWLTTVATRPSARPRRSRSPSGRRRAHHRRDRGGLPRARSNHGAADQPAKQGIREAGATFSMPPPSDVESRLRAVLQVLYLIFNEGYTTSSGDEITRTDLTHEAIRLMRQLRLVRPGDAEVKGLLALMLLTEARRPARIDPAGRLVDLADQDRSLWNQSLIEEGVQLVTEALQQGPPGAYQLQAAIAAIYDEASHPEDTGWPQILLLYQLLDRLTPNPMATLNRALALAMVAGPQAGLDLLATLDDDKRVASHHRLFAVRGHLLEMAGNSAAATEAFETAARRCTSLPERAYLQERARAALRR